MDALPEHGSRRTRPNPLTRRPHPLAARHDTAPPVAGAGVVDSATATAVLSSAITLCSRVASSVHGNPLQNGIAEQVQTKPASRSASAVPRTPPATPTVRAAAASLASVSRPTFT